MSGREFCVDCAANTYQIGEYYMVRSAVWADAWILPRGGMLCIGCLESRLGRSLTASDFTDVLINSISHRGERMSERLINRLNAK